MIKSAKWLLVALLFISAVPLRAASPKHSCTIWISDSASVQERFAAREIRRYAYLRTGILAGIEQAQQAPSAKNGIVIGLAGSEWLKSVASALPAELGQQEYALKSRGEGNKEQLVIAGGSPVGCLYGAYEFLESLGIRFYLHGDTVPDGMAALKLSGFDVVRRPLFEVRGIQPFHDFAVGPDWWDGDDYKLHITQLAKMRMNMIGLHTYPEGKPYAEPTVWIGLPDDVNPDGTVKTSYTSAYNNTLAGQWGHAPKPTGKFAFGASQLFETDAYGSEVMEGMIPRPTTPEQCNLLFDRTGKMFAGAFGLGNLLGVQATVGTEAPLTVPRTLLARLSQTAGEQAIGVRDCVMVSSAGSTSQHTVDIPGAEEPAIFQFVRYGVEKYVFDLPNGSYDVDLLFAEHWKDAPGMRVFTVSLQSKVVLEHFDIFKQVGKSRPYTFTRKDVSVDHGRLTISFMPEVEHPAIAGIVIRGKTITRKINCGGPSVKDWEAEPAQLHTEEAKVSDDLLLKLYEGMFTRIMKTHHLDYFWIWTPEGEAVKYSALLNELQIARKALHNLGDPFKLAISGWGNVGESFRHLDRDLPRDITFTGLNPEGGRNTVDPAYKDLNRPKWTIPWFENDGEFLGAVLKVGWMRADAKMAREYGCTGLLGLHWRTQPNSLQAAALAQAGWTQNWRDYRSPLPVPLVAGEGAVGGLDTTYIRHTRFHEKEKQQPPFFISSIGGTKGEEANYRYGRHAMSAYKFNVPNGSYKVTLKFCEWGVSKVGDRVFDIKIQGQLVESKLDVVARTGGPARALVTEYPDVKVTGGQMVIDFVPNPQGPILNAIVIEQTDGKYVRKVNCGGPTFADYAGEQFRRDLTGDFYLDWARTEFGEAIAPQAALLLEKWDSWLPWVSEWGPGAAEPDDRPLSEALREIAWIDDFLALGSRLKTAGAKSRFEYWANLLRYHKAITVFNCAWGNKLPEQEQTEALRQVYNCMIPMVGTKGGLGQIAHWEQFVLGTQLGILSGSKRQLPGAYSGPALLLNPCPRTTVQKAEDLKIKALFVDQQPPSRFSVFWRPLGTKKFTSRNVDHLARGVYQTQLKTADFDREGQIEYYLQAETASGRKLVWPATAPERNHTVSQIPE